MTTLQQLSSSQVSPEVPINENFDALSAVAFGGKKNDASSGLTWGYYGGRWGGTSVADGTLALTASADNYVVVANATGALSVSTGTTNWADTTNYRRVYKLTTGTSGVTAVEDHRAGPYGLWGGGSSTGSSTATGVSIQSISAAYTLALADAGTCLYHPPSDTTSRTWTIPANASVAFPVGTIITLDNDYGAGAITVDITSDAMVLVGTAGSTGSRTIAPGGQATLLKVSATRWRISGVGVS